MNVYIVAAYENLWSDGSNRAAEFVGVFSTYEKAEERLKVRFDNEKPTLVQIPDYQVRTDYLLLGGQMWYWRQERWDGIKHGVIIEMQVWNMIDGAYDDSFINRSPAPGGGYVYDDVFIVSSFIYSGAISPDNNYMMFYRAFSKFEDAAAFVQKMKDPYTAAKPLSKTKYDQFDVWVAPDVKGVVTLAVFGYQLDKVPTEVSR